MIRRFGVFVIVLTFASMVVVLSCKKEDKLVVVDNPKILSYVIDSKKKELKMYWKDGSDSNYFNFKHLESALKKENKKLTFATNGGMYNKNVAPQGLYVEDYIMLSEVDTLQKGHGNFYLQPNGVFYLTDKGLPNVVTTSNFVANETIRYATQSGPMLLIDGEMHPKFNMGSTNLNIRNGVGLLPDGSILFAMSKEKINFYDFALYFKQHGCENALYLDGFVSKTYLPSEDWEQLDGNFGVIIGETE